VIQIFCGLELEFHPILLEQNRKIRENYPLDYCHGSIHVIDDWHLETPGSFESSKHRHKSIEEAYQLYFDNIKKAVNTGLFDSLAHLDYYRRSLLHPPGAPPETCLEIFDDVAEFIAKKNVPVEINTRGRTVDTLQEFHPTRPLLVRLIRSGTNFCLGSDAHEEGRIGEGLREATIHLSRLGVTSLTYFKSHQKLHIPI
jgi:histidinol-phosphatase (PHP family)